jgi:small subunit ribosomal protein S20
VLDDKFIEGRANVESYLRCAFLVQVADECLDGSLLLSRKRTNQLQKLLLLFFGHGCALPNQFYFKRLAQRESSRMALGCANTFRSILDLTGSPASRKIVEFYPTRRNVSATSLEIKELEEDQEFMANHFSALKRARQTETRTERNRAVRSQLRSALREVRETIDGGDKQKAQASLRATIAAIDSSVNKGVLHKNTASRYKSRLSTRVAAIGAK